MFLPQEKNGKRKYSFVVISHAKNYFVKLHSDFTHKYSEIDIKQIYIDGSHDYEIVRKDLASSLPYLKSGGLPD